MLNRFLAQIFLSLITITFFARPSATDNRTYSSLADLKQEIGNRKDDIARTKSRIESLLQQEQKLVQELDQSRTLAVQIDQHLTVRTRLLYRLSRNGGGVRYLLSSTSAIDLMRRIGELRHLLTLSLDERHGIGVKIAATEGQLKDVREEMSSANTMLAMLEQALRELRASLRKKQ